jgi:hypothetical protein
MMKTLFATTAIASTLAFGALAQEAAPAADPLVPPAADAPADAMPADPAADTAQDPGGMMPAEPETETVQDAQPDAMTPAEPETETVQDAQPDAMTPAEPGAETVQDGLAPADPMLGDAGPVLTPVAAGDISAETLIGTTIQTPDGDNIAEVDDVLMTPDGAVDNIVATFGGFLGFGSNTVLLTLDEIEVMQDEAGNFVVQTSLTPEALEGRPDYEAVN